MNSPGRRIVFHLYFSNLMWTSSYSYYFSNVRKPLMFDQYLHIENAIYSKKLYSPVSIYIFLLRTMFYSDNYPKPHVFWSGIRISNASIICFLLMFPRAISLNQQSCGLISTICNFNVSNFC